MTESDDDRFYDLLEKWERRRSEASEVYLSEFDEIEPELRGRLLQAIHALRGVDWLGREPDASVSLDTQKLGRQDAQVETVSNVPSGRGAELKAVARDFANYEILEEIARGGMGVVYRAREKTLDRVVALKMILGSDLATSEQAQRFLSEARAVGRLSHPGIVPIYEIGDANGRPYFTMEFATGGSLQAKLKQGPLPPREAADLVRQIAEALDHAHRHGVVHRDVKPHNVLLDHEGRPRVSDFGLAKRIDAAEGLTVTGDVLGTPAYMAPEQASGGAKQATPSADVYSLGALLYATLTGKPPFAGSTIGETMRALLEDPPVSPRALRREVPPDLETVCLKCLEKSPAKRYPSAAALAEDLGRFLAGEPTLARPVGRVAKAARWVRRRPLVASLGLVGVLAVVSITVAGVATDRALRADRVTELRTRLAERLKSVELEGGSVSDAEALASAVAALDPELRDAVENSVVEAWSNAVVARIDAPRLDDADVATIERAIERLSSKSAAIAKSLADRLEARLGEWRSVFRFAAPSDELPPQMRGARLIGGAICVDPDEPAKPVEIGVVATEADNLIVTFGGDWRSADVLTAAVPHGERDGYRVEVLHLRPKAKVPAATLPAESMRLAIKRDGRTLQEAEYPLHDFPEEVLKLEYRREGNSLYAKLGDRPGLSFEDAMSVVGVSGVFALTIPTGVTIENLEIRQKKIDAATGDLDRADQDFYAGRYREAERLYADVAREASGAYADESYFKRGLALAKLEDPLGAEAAFRAASADPSSRWSILATGELWEICGRRGDVDGMNAAEERLWFQPSHADLSRMLPIDTRQSIVRRYLAQSDSDATFLERDVTDVSRIERAADLAVRFAVDDYSLRLSLMSARESAGDLQGATVIAQEYSSGSGKGPFARHYIRLLRIQKDYDLARREIERLKDVLVPEDGSLPFVLLEEVRLELEQGATWAAVEGRAATAVHEAAKLSSDPRIEGVVAANAALLEGYCKEREGQRDAAFDAWRAGWTRVRPALADGAPWPDLTLKAAILAGLSRSVDAQSVRLLLNRFAGEGARTGAMATTVISLAAADARLVQTVEQMWDSPFGRRLAWDLALDRIPTGQKKREAFALAAGEYFRRGAFDLKCAPEHDEQCYQTARDVFDCCIANERERDRMMQLLLLWKGLAGPAAWPELERKLPEHASARFAWLLGHRTLFRGMSKESAIAYWEEAASSSDPDLQSLSKRDLRLAAAGSGIVAIKGVSSKPVILRFENASGHALEKEISGETFVELAAGAYDVSTEEGLRVEPRRVDVGLCRCVYLSVAKEPASSQGDAGSVNAAVSDSK